MQQFDSKIEDYLDGVLEGTELSDFLAAMQGNPALAQKVEVAGIARARMRNIWASEPAEQELRNTIQAIRSADSQPQEPGAMAKRMRIPPWYWAAAALLVLGFAFWMLRPTSTEQLYADNRVFPETAFVSKGDEATPLQKAATDFEHKHYQSALDGFQRYLSSHPDDREVQLFQGFCLLELGKWSEAAQIFANLNSTTLADEANWYLALCYLKGKDTARCKAQLMGISESSMHYKNAQNLLRKLR